jgi:hypothetical protein
VFHLSVWSLYDYRLGLSRFELDSQTSKLVLYLLFSLLNSCGGGSSTDGSADIQYDLLIADGATVAAGDILGSLLYVGDGAHVHFGLTEDYTWLCPMPFFTTAAGSGAD